MGLGRPILRNWIKNHVGSRIRVNRILSVSFFSLVIDLITKTSRALVFILIARILGPGPGGVLAVALSYQAIFQTLTLSGVDYLVIREVARDKTQAADYFNHIALIRALLFVVSYALLSMMVYFLYGNQATTTGVVLIMGLGILPDGLGELCRAFFVAQERLRFPATVAALTGSLKVAVVYGLLRQGADLQEVAWVVVIFSGVSTCCSIVYIYMSYLKRRPIFYWPFFRDILPSLGSFAGMGVLRVLEYNTIILILSFIGGERQTGIYNASYTLILAILMLSQAYANGIIPELSRLYAKSRHEEIRNYYRKSMKGITVILLPTLFFLFLAAPIIIPTIFTAAYQESIAVFRVLIPVIFFTFFSTPQIVLLLAVNRQNAVVGIVCVSIAVSAVGAVSAIPSSGAVGAAASRVLATGCVTVLSYILCSKALVSLPSRKSSVVSKGLPEKNEGNKWD